MCDVASALEACTVASAAHSPAPSASSAALPPIQPTLHRAGLTAVPDLNGVRFCRVCNAFLPLSMFPAGHRRYTCRPHLWQRVGKKARQTAYNAVPRRRLLASIWTRCWKDAKNSNCLGMALASPLVLKQADIGCMLDTLEAGQSRKFGMSSPGHISAAGDAVVGEQGVFNALEPQRWTCMDAVAVLPADLSMSISKENAVLVTKSTRRVLLDKLRRVRKALSGHKALNTPNAAAHAEQQKQLASLWRKSIQTASLLPPAASVPPDGSEDS